MVPLTRPSQRATPKLHDQFRLAESRLEEFYSIPRTDGMTVFNVRTLSESESHFLKNSVSFQCLQSLYIPGGTWQAFNQKGHSSSSDAREGLLTSIFRHIEIFASPLDQVFHVSWRRRDAACRMSAPVSTVRLPSSEKRGTKRHHIGKTFTWAILYASLNGLK